MYDYENRWVVSIGVSEYDARSTFRRLKNAVADARSVFEVFTKHFGCNRTQGRLGAWLRGPLENPDAAVIRNALADLQPVVGADDLLVFFYAGHGTPGALAARGARRTDLEALGLLPYSDLHAMIGDIPCRHKLLIYDSCHAGSAFLHRSMFEAGGSRVSGREDSSGPIVPLDRTDIIASSDLREQAWDAWMKTIDHSPFVEAMCAVLLRAVEAGESLEPWDLIGRIGAYLREEMRWDPLESTCRHASLSIL